MFNLGNYVDHIPTQRKTKLHDKKKSQQIQDFTKKKRLRLYATCNFKLV